MKMEASEKRNLWQEYTKLYDKVTDWKPLGNVRVDVFRHPRDSFADACETLLTHPSAACAARHPKLYADYRETYDRMLKIRGALWELNERFVEEGFAPILPGNAFVQVGDAYASVLADGLVDGYVAARAEALEHRVPVEERKELPQNLTGLCARIAGEIREAGWDWILCEHPLCVDPARVIGEFDKSFDILANWSGRKYVKAVKWEPYSTDCVLAAKFCNRIAEALGYEKIVDLPCNFEEVKGMYERALERAREEARAVCTLGEWPDDEEVEDLRFSFEEEEYLYKRTLEKWLNSCDSPTRYALDEALDEVRSRVNRKVWNVYRNAYEASADYEHTNRSNYRYEEKMEHTNPDGTVEPYKTEYPPIWDDVYGWEVGRELLDAVSAACAARLPELYPDGYPKCGPRDPDLYPDEYWEEMAHQSEWDSDDDCEDEADQSALDSVACWKEAARIGQIRRAVEFFNALTRSLDDDCKLDVDLDDDRALSDLADDFAEGLVAYRYEATGCRMQNEVAPEAVQKLEGSFVEAVRALVKKVETAGWETLIADPKWCVGRYMLVDALWEKLEDIVDSAEQSVLCAADVRDDVRFINEIAVKFGYLPVADVDAILKDAEAYARFLNEVREDYKND